MEKPSLREKALGTCCLVPTWPGSNVHVCTVHGVVDQWCMHTIASELWATAKRIGSGQLAQQWLENFNHTQSVSTEVMTYIAVGKIDTNDFSSCHFFFFSTCYGSIYTVELSHTHSYIYTCM